MNTFCWWSPNTSIPVSPFFQVRFAWFKQSLINSQEIKSDKIVVVEGIATMYEKVRDAFDIKIYIETDNPIRRERFIKRAKAERNQNEENAIKQWEYLLHAGEKYVIPCREHADFVIDGNSDLNYFDHIFTP